jgi:hypothetical protein
MISIREEIREIEAGKASRTDNLLKHAPHAPDVVSAGEHLGAHGLSRGWIVHQCAG